MTISERIDAAHASLEQIDDYKADLVLYVDEMEHPVVALKKIRAFLIGESDDSNGVALAVACLDRVIDNLSDFQMRRVFEENTK